MAFHSMDLDTLSPEGSYRGVRGGGGPVLLSPQSVTRWSLVESAEAETALGPAHGLATMRVPAGEEPAQQGAAQPQYHLRRVVGRGGMGEVWEAVQCSLGRVVAVKRLRERTGGALQSGEAAREFLREGVIAARLEHPNIVPVHDFGQTPDGDALLAMKYVQGRSWDRVLAEDMALPLPEMLAKHLPILVSMAQAVAFAHSRGVVHRDLKPSQVMIGEFGEVMLMDWGLAMVIGEGEEPRSLVPSPVSLPTRGSATNPAGTPVLMAPEQTGNNAGEIGPWTDVFLLGGTLFYMLTGDYPFTAETARQAMLRAASEQAPDPRTVRPDRGIPEDLAHLCVHAMQRNRAARRPSARAFIEGLQDHLSGARRRKEAEQHRDAAAKLLPQAKEYREFNEVLSLAAQSLSLWPTLFGVAELQREANLGYAETALQAGDLELARLQTDRLPAAEPRRDALHGSIAAARDARRKKDSQRRLFAQGVIALLLALLTGGLWSYSALNRRAEEITKERNNAESSSEAARQQAANARGMAEYLLWNMSNSLDLTLSKDAEFAASITVDVVDRLSGLNTEGWPEELQREHFVHLIKIIERLMVLGQPLKGLTLCEDAERLATRLGGPDSKETAQVSYYRGLLLLDLSRNKEAHDVLETAVKLGIRHSGMTNFATADSVRALAEAKHLLGDSQAGLELLREARRALRAAGLRNNVHYIRNIARAGRIHRDLDDRESAIAHIGHAMKMVFEMKLQNDLEGNQIITEYGMAQCHGPYGDFPLAEEIFTQQLQMSEKFHGTGHPIVEEIRAEMGRVIAEQTRFEEGIEMMLQAHNSLIARVGPNHELVKQIEEKIMVAEERQARRERLEKPGPADWDDARAEALWSYQKGRRNTRQSRLELALEELNNARSLLSRLGETDSELYADVMYEFGMLGWIGGDLPAAKQYLKEGFDLRVRLLPSTDPRLGQAYCDYGAVCCIQRGYATGIPLLEKAIELQSENLGPTHRDTIRTWAYLARALGNTGDKEKLEPVIRLLAEAQFTQTMDIYEKARSLSIAVEDPKPLDLEVD